jgi:hypothetical protein
LSDGGTLAALGDVLINEFHQLKLTRKIVEGRDTTKLCDTGSQSLDLGILKAFEQRIGSAQILDDDWAGSAINAAGLDNVVIRVPVDDLALDARHCFSVYALTSRCQHEVIPDTV